MKYIFFILSLFFIYESKGQSTTTYSIESKAFASTGDFAPLWFSANRFGLLGTGNSSGYLMTGIKYNKKLKHNFRFIAGVDLSGGWNTNSNLRLQQAFIEVSWKNINLYIGRKENFEYPLKKNIQLSSGMMVEGQNTLPIPQVRAGINEYVNIPITKDWLSFKGHIAYGLFYENNWQENFVKPKSFFTKDVLYHSKSLMFKLGNKEKFPFDFEFGILMATQFGGNKFIKNEDSSTTLVFDMPNNAKAFWKAFFPQSGGSDTPKGEQINMEGNHVGSWNFSLNFYYRDCIIKSYLEHFFEDHSQMFWEYGSWKDGQFGLEFIFNNHKWLHSLVLEAIYTKDQSGPVLYDGILGQFPEYQISANDDYYNHYIYGAWQYMGMGIGNPLIPGPLYNKNNKISFISNRINGYHLGVKGAPLNELEYRILVSFVNHFGTYYNPLNDIQKQFSSLIEITYLPKTNNGLNISLSVGIDKGNFLGNSTGLMLSFKKTGCFKN